MSIDNYRLIKLLEVGAHLETMSEPQYERIAITYRDGWDSVNKKPINSHAWTHVFITGNKADEAKAIKSLKDMLRLKKGILVGAEGHEILNTIRRPVVVPEFEDEKKPETDH